MEASDVIDNRLVAYNLQSVSESVSDIPKEWKRLINESEMPDFINLDRDQQERIIDIIKSKIRRLPHGLDSNCLHITHQNDLHTMAYIPKAHIPHYSICEMQLSDLQNVYRAYANSLEETVSIIESVEQMSKFEWQEHPFVDRRDA